VVVVNVPVENPGPDEPDEEVPTPVKTLLAPACFGDTGMVVGEVRNASVISVTFSKLYMLRVEEFHELLCTYPAEAELIHKRTVQQRAIDSEENEDTVRRVSETPEYHKRRASRTLTSPIPEGRLSRSPSFGSGGSVASPSEGRARSLSESASPNSGSRGLSLKAAEGLSLDCAPKAETSRQDSLASMAAGPVEMSGSDSSDDDQAGSARSSAAEDLAQKSFSSPVMDHGTTAQPSSRRSSLMPPTLRTASKPDLYHGMPVAGGVGLPSAALVRIEARLDRLEAQQSEGFKSMDKKLEALLQLNAANRGPPKKLEKTASAAAFSLMTAGQQNGTTAARQANVLESTWNKSSAESPRKGRNSDAGANGFASALRKSSILQGTMSKMTSVRPSSPVSPTTPVSPAEKGRRSSGRGRSNGDGLGSYDSRCSAPM
jgi:hypothetical protein